MVVPSADDEGSGIVVPKINPKNVVPFTAREGGQRCEVVPADEIAIDELGVVDHPAAHVVLLE